MGRQEIGAKSLQYSIIIRLSTCIKGSDFIPCRPKGGDKYAHASTYKDEEKISVPEGRVRMVGCRLRPCPVRLNEHGIPSWISIKKVVSGTHHGC